MVTRIVCLECVIKADRNQSWGQGLKCPVPCSWHPNKTIQMDKLEVKISAWLGNLGCAGREKLIPNHTWSLGCGEGSIIYPGPSSAPLSPNLLQCVALGTLGCI